MDTRKGRKEQTMIYKTLHRKLKIECHQYQGWSQVPLKSWQFLLHMWYPSCYSCYKRVVYI